MQPTQMPDSQAKRPSKSLVRVVALISLLAFVRAEAQPKSNHGVLQASDFLPADLRKCESYTVADTVRNDGLINTYQVATKYGVLTIESTALLRKRLNELRALERMEQLKKSDLYVDALKLSVTAPIDTAKGMVTAPIETTEGIVTGVGRWFRDVGSAVTSKEPQEDTLIERTSGQAKAKRQFAFEYGVDPYSSFPPLQKVLDDIAWAAAGGSLTVSGALAIVPGAAGALVMTTKTAGDMKELVRDRSPSELSRLNRQKLAAMGVPENLIEYFLMNPAYSPEEQTILIGELDSMSGVKDRHLFLRKAGSVGDEATAVFNRVQAQMFAAYHAKIGKVARCIDAAGVILLEKEDGSVVGLFPLDHVVWTQGVSQKAMSISAALKDRAGKGKMEFWLLGTVDPSAADGLNEMGWKVIPQAGERLFGR